MTASTSKASGKGAPKKAPVHFTASAVNTATTAIAMRMAEEAGTLAKAHDAEGLADIVPKQAFAVAAAYKSGLLGGSRKPGETAEMTQERYAGIVGLSQSRISNFRTLGHALVTVGVKPEGEDWRRLVAVARTVGKVVQKLADDSDKSKSVVRNAVNKHFTEDGKRKPTPRGSDGTGADVNALFEAAFAASNAADTFDRVVAHVVGRLTSGDNRVNAAGRKSIAEGVEAITTALAEAEAIAAA